MRQANSIAQHRSRDIARAHPNSPPCRCSSEYRYTSALDSYRPKLTTLFSTTFRNCLAAQDGGGLGIVLNPTRSETHSFAYSSNHAQIRSTIQNELYGITSFRVGITDKGQKAWVDAIVAYWEVVYELERGHTGRQLGEDGDLGYWGRAYQKQCYYATCV